MTLTLRGYNFEHVCEIRLELDSNRNILEFLPQNRYENKKKLKLNKYGRGPFCKFAIDKKYSKKSGVYVILVNSVIQYVGESIDLFKRFGMGYGNISPRNCFEGGQLTNCRINSAILELIKSNHSIHLNFFETDKRCEIECELISDLNPAWNKTSRKSYKIQ